MSNKEKFDVDKAFWINQYVLLMFMVKLIVVLAIGLMTYAFLGNDLFTMFEQPQLPTQAEMLVQQRKSAAIAAADSERVENGIHVQTGLVYAEGFDVVRGTCTACHSAKLVTQNRATREGWKDMIVWMQKTQKLWDLGANEPIILDYLAAHYAPEDKGRRENIDVAAIEWYLLDLSNEQ